MKTIFITLGITSALLVNASTTYAGLAWNKGTLGNPDNLNRSASAIAYDPNGSIYVAGYEEVSNGSRKIVTKKYSASGALLYSTSNIYVIPVGTIISDYVRSITLDASGNVYVLCGQFGSASRGEDIVVLKYNSTLTLQWRRYIYNTAYPNTDFDDVPGKLLIDASGNIYVMGIWYNATTPDDDQIVVRKLNSSGTTLFTSTISESSIKIVGKSADICIDNSSNLTVVAGVKYNNVYKLVYARINSSGTVQWTKYQDPQSGFFFTYTPKIACSPTGTLYISSGMAKLVQQPYTFVSKLNLSQFSQDGTKVWDRYTSQIDFYPNDITMRLDASENIYFGMYYSGPQDIGVNNFRIYKYNSSGTMQWTYLSSEVHNQFLSFELFGSSALFAIHYDNSAGHPKLKKINAATGGLIWSENILVTQPPSFTFSDAWPAGISINKNTSEVAYCGYIIGAEGSPTFDEEMRWNVRKYNATSPRLALENSTGAGITPSASVFPNPANDLLHIQFDNDQYPSALSIYDIQGKLLKKITENISEDTDLPINDLPEGMILIYAEFQDAVVVRKVMISR